MISSDATRSNFLKKFYQYKIIQLYTHAAQNGLNNEPVIYFSDSIMRLSELISENKTLTKLIVLSACETGLGKDYRGKAYLVLTAVLLRWELHPPSPIYGR